MPDDSLKLEKAALERAIGSAIDIARRGGAVGATADADLILMQNVKPHIESLLRTHERLFCEALLSEGADVVQRVLSRYLQARER